MQEQDLKTSEKSTYWVVALFLFILLGGLIWSLAGNKDDEKSLEESSEQFLEIPEVETITLLEPENTGPGCYLPFC